MLAALAARASEAASSAVLSFRRSAATSPLRLSILPFRSSISSSFSLRVACTRVTTINTAAVSARRYYSAHPGRTWALVSLFFTNCSQRPRVSDPRTHQTHTLRQPPPPRRRTSYSTFGIPPLRAAPRPAAPPPPAGRVRPACLERMALMAARGLTSAVSCHAVPPGRVLGMKCDAGRLLRASEPQRIASSRLATR